MITVAELDSYVDANLDAEGSQRFLFAQDKIPNYNAAISRAITACNWALANKKGSEEALSELQETRICQTNIYGGLTLDSLWTNNNTLSPYKVWSVLAFYAEPSMSPAQPLVPFSPPSRSFILSDRIYTPGGANERPVQRMTVEQIAVARDNQYMSGNEVLAAGPLRTYAYYVVGNRTQSDFLISGDREVIFTPRSRFTGGPKYIAMSFLREPNLLTTDTDTIPFPQSMARTLASWALEYMSIKLGDGTTLNSTAEKDAAQLFTFSTQ